MNKMYNENKKQNSVSIDDNVQSWERSLSEESKCWQTEGVVTIDTPDAVKHLCATSDTLQELSMNDRKGLVKENTPYYIIDIDLVLKKLYGRWRLVNDRFVPEISINDDFCQLPNIKGTVYKVKETDRLLINNGSSYRII